MPAKKKACKSPGTLEYIDGKWWCIGEKVISKWKHSRHNKTKKTKSTGKKTKTTGKTRKSK